MKTIWIFFTTYCKHSKGFIELILFVLGLLGFILPEKIKIIVIPVWLSIGMIFLSFLYASYKTWLYEYKKNQKENNLSDLQKMILRVVNNSSNENKLITVSDKRKNIFLRGDIYTNCEALKKYETEEVIANIEDLNTKGFLNKTSQKLWDEYSVSKKGRDYER